MLKKPQTKAEWDAWAKEFFGDGKEDYRRPDLAIGPCLRSERRGRVLYPCPRCKGRMFPDWLDAQNPNRGWRCVNCSGTISAHYFDHKDATRKGMTAKGSNVILGTKT